MPHKHSAEGRAWRVGKGHRSRLGLSPPALRRKVQKRPAHAPRAQAGREHSTGVVNYDFDAEPRIPPTAAEGGRCIVVNGIPENVGPDSIREALEAGGVGEILRCRVNTGTCWIELRRSEDAQTAIREYNNGEINDERITVTLATSLSSSSSQAFQ